jgi:DUF1680 family protein
VARVNGLAYGKSDGTVWINLYGSGTLDTTLDDGSRFRLEQKTNYPWDGEIQMTVLTSCSSPMRLKLRIPGWAESARLTVDGASADVAIVPGTYATLRRAWRAGTKLHLHIPMPPQLLESHPLVEETRNHVALKRGPVVYCVESTDLPKDTSLADVRIPSDIQLEPRFDPELLGGITTLEGTAMTRPTGDWQGKLYRPLERPKDVRIPIRFIPYYTWSNRGPAEMSVWLPLD